MLDGLFTIHNAQRSIFKILSYAFFWLIGYTQYTKVHTAKISSFRDLGAVFSNNSYRRLKVSLGPVAIVQIRSRIGKYSFDLLIKHNECIVKGGFISESF